MLKNILVVEDEVKMLRLLELQLQGSGYKVSMADSAERGLEILNQDSDSASRFSLVLTDLRLPGMDGLEFLTKVQGTFPSLPLIVMTAFGTVETAVEAMKAGASDYVLKPFSLEDLMITIDKVLELHALRDENIKLKTELGRRYDFGQIIGRSPNMQEVFDAASRVAPTRTTVLLGGESGTGKGSIGAGDSLSFAEKRRSVYEDQLLVHSREFNGVGAVRIRKRGLHRSDAVSSRQV